MRTKTAAFLIPVLLASLALGQTVTRTYTFTHIADFQEFQEIATLMRSMAGVVTVSTDNAQKTAIQSGTPEQIGITDWLFKELDQPPAGQAPVTFAVSKDDIVELFYLPSTKTVQDFQEIVNGIRTVFEIKQAFGENTQRALLLRGTAAQLAQAAWMVNDVTQPTHSAAAHQYQLAPDDVAQIFYLTHPANVQEFQEIANLIRTVGEIRRAVAENTPRALIMRGTPSQIAMAAWLADELDQTPPPSAAHSYSASSDDVVRVFYLPSTGTVQDFQATAVRIRNATQIRRVGTLSAQRAFVLRATPTQIAQAEQLLK